VGNVQAVCRQTAPAYRSERITELYRDILGAGCRDAGRAATARPSGRVHPQAYHRWDVLDDVQIHVLVYRHAFQCRLVQRDVQNALLLSGGKASCQIGTELGFEQRDAVVASTLVADGIFAYDFVQRAAVVQRHGQRVGDGAPLGVVVVGREGRVFDADDFFTQGINAWVGRDVVFVVGSGQASKDEGDRHHVLNAVVAVGRVVQRARLVNDAYARFMGAYGDFPYVFAGPAGLAQRLVQLHGAFDG